MIDFDAVQMDDGEDWLMRPIRAGFLPFNALKDTAYDLGDFVFACEALDVEAENQARSRKAQAAHDATRRK